jgi:antitoxin PrlF
LPRAFRERFRLKPGDRVEFLVDDDGQVRMVPRTTSVTRLKGMLPKPERPVSLEQMDAAIAQAASEGGAGLEESSAWIPTSWCAT